jgi:hypothetical protein
MNSNVNQGAWKAMENRWAAALGRGRTVKVSVDVVTNQHSAGSRTLPEESNGRWQRCGDRQTESETCFSIFFQRTTRRLPLGLRSQKTGQRPKIRFEDSAGNVSHFTFENAPRGAIGDINEAVMELREEMAQGGGTEWNRSTFTTHRNGDFNVEFSYEEDGA